MPGPVIHGQASAGRAGPGLRFVRLVPLVPTDGTCGCLTWSRGWLLCCSEPSSRDDPNGSWRMSRVVGCVITTFLVVHVTLSRPALSFLSGRCGRASQHKVFRNTTSFSDWPLFNTLLAATNTEFPLVTSDTVSRPLPEHSTTQTSHNNPHVCRPHRNGTPSLLSERHNAARNTRTCGIMTRHAPPCDDAKIGTPIQQHVIKVAMQHFGRRSATPMHGEPSTHISHEVRHFGLVLPQASKSPIPQSEISEILGCGAWVW